MGRCCAYSTNPGYTNPGYTNPGYTNPGYTYYYSCNCQTCSYQGLSIVKSVASTISAVTSGTTTVLSAGGTAASPTVGQYKTATCIKTATDTWYVVGAIS